LRFLRYQPIRPKIPKRGDLDFCGTRGVSREFAVGFKAIRLKFIIDTDAKDEQIESVSKLTERYCVVFQTLINGVQLQTSFDKL
jgi:uncharacterized OsmC-like protein